MSPNQGEDSLTNEILGAALDIHRLLGFSLPAAVYRTALAGKLASRQIPYRRDAPIKTHFKGKRLDSPYRIDFLCYEVVLVSVLVSAQIDPAQEAQMINFLRTSRTPRGLLLNFGAHRLQYKRYVYGQLLRPVAEDHR